MTASTETEAMCFPPKMRVILFADAKAVMAPDPVGFPLKRHVSSEWRHIRFGLCQVHYIPRADLIWASRPRSFLRSDTSFDTTFRFSLFSYFILYSWVSALLALLTIFLHNSGRFILRALILPIFIYLVHGEWNRLCFIRRKFIVREKMPKKGL